jgi:hypothetical protein
MVKFYYEFWKQILETQFDANPWERSVLRGIRYLLDPVLLNRLFKGIPPFAHERIEGIAGAVGLPFRDLATVLVLPDLFPMLQAYLSRIRPQMFVEVAFPKFGCSSFIHSGDHFLHGRNLDFPGVGYWDRFPVIQATWPAKGLRYVGFTSAGVPIGGITGINEAQISVSLHQHYCRKTSLKGVLPFVIAERILMEARSLDDALGILRSSQVATSWAFIVTDGKKRDGFVYECHPYAAGIRFLAEHEGLLAHANYFQTGECQPAEYATTARMNWDNYWRKTRLENLVRAAGHAMTPAQACQIISDHFDPYWGVEKIVNRTVSQLYNIQSLVLDPEKMRVWIAEGDAPIHLGQYQEYDLAEVLAGRNGRTDTRHAGYRFRSSALKAAKEAYILSFIAGFERKYDEALNEAERSRSLDMCAEVSLVTAVLKLKKGDYQDARERLAETRLWLEKKVRASGRKKLPPEYFEILLFEARSLDLLGRREEAIRIYQDITSHRDLEDAHLRRLAARQGPYSPHRLSRLVMPYSTYVPFE